MEVKIFIKELKIEQSFWGKPGEFMDSGAEAEINAWLASNSSISVKEIKQSMSGGSMAAPAKFVISVFGMNECQKNRADG